MKITACRISIGSGCACSSIAWSDTPSATGIVFEDASKTIPVAEGVSLQAMLELAQPDPMLMRHAVIFIGGYRIERRYWHCVYPRPAHW